jgi:hypothetical protein
MKIILFFFLCILKIFLKKFKKKLFFYLLQINISWCFQIILMRW